MCGIVGIHRFDGRSIDPMLLATMTATLTHRGPDADGSWFSDDRTTAFGHRRLSIIDLGGSPQPMQSADGHLTVCFNGEIFNYRELRSRLEYPWHTDGDTGLGSDRQAVARVRVGTARAVRVRDPRLRNTRTVVVP